MDQLFQYCIAGKYTVIAEMNEKSYGVSLVLISFPVWFSLPEKFGMGW